jgi:TatD DNase family protein
MQDTPFEIVDSHCHLDFQDFDAERADVVDRAVAAGVRRMVTICTKLRQAPQVQAIAEAHAPVFWAAGTHPMSAAEEPMATVDELIALAQHPKFVGIGESGLDYHYTADSAGRAAAKPAHPYRRRARDGPAAHHPCPRRR